MFWAGALAVLVALGVLYVHRPAGQFFYPRCSLYTMTGLYCPGCGGLRAGHELLHGHLFEAARSNVLLVLGIPAAFGWWAWCRCKARPVLSLTPRMVVALFALLAFYTILRNLPGWPFTLLAP